MIEQVEEILNQLEEAQIMLRYALEKTTALHEQLEQQDTYDDE